MINLQLLIDDVNYTSHIREDRDFILKNQIELTENNPISSELTFTLDNASNFQDIFLNNQPYSLGSEGKVELFVDSQRMFKGYIDKNAVPVDFRLKDIEIKALGNEASISRYLSRFDITQLYYLPGFDVGDARYRGGRTGTARFNPLERHPIYDLVKTMLQDIGFDENDIIINYRNTSNFTHKYDPNRYGPITEKRPIAKVRNYGQRGYTTDTDSNRYISFAEDNERDDSYNFLLKEFAKITGCIFFQDYRTEKILFINRDFNFLSSLGLNLVALEDYILDEELPITYRYAYSGLFFKFDDINVGVTPSNPLLFITSKIGIEATDSSWLLTPVVLGGGQTGLFYGPPLTSPQDPLKYLIEIEGENRLNEAMSINNALQVKMTANLSDYVIDADEVPPANAQKVYIYFTDYVLDNYDFLLRRFREQKVTLDGIFNAPFRASYGEHIFNIFDTEIDFINEKTIATFEY